MDCNITSRGANHGVLNFLSDRRAEVFKVLVVYNAKEYTLLAETFQLIPILLDNYIEI